MSEATGPDPQRLESLLLAYLAAAAGRSRRAAEVRQGVRSLLEPFHGWSQTVEKTLDRLAERGAVGRRVPPGRGRTVRYELADAGRRELEAHLQPARLPAGRVRWPTMRDTILVAAALGRPAPAGGREKSNFKTQVQIALLRQCYGLDAKSATTLTALRNMMAWRLFEQLLGLEEGDGGRRGPFPEAPARLLLCRLLGEKTTRLPCERLLGELAARAVAGRGARTLKVDLLRRWLGGGELVQRAPLTLVQEPAPQQPPAAPPASGQIASRSAPAASTDTPTGLTQDRPTDGQLQRFARRVLETARACRTGRPHGPDKVFISHVWHELCEAGDPMEPADSLPRDEARFKRWLALANNRGHLRLSRADLVEVYDPRDIARSETRHLGARFHFIRL